MLMNSVNSLSFGGLKKAFLFKKRTSALDQRKVFDRLTKMDGDDNQVAMYPGNDQRQGTLIVVEKNDDPNSFSSKEITRFAGKEIIATGEISRKDGVGPDRGIIDVDV
jgi:hypothetical protein